MISNAGARLTRLTIFTNPSERLGIVSLAIARGNIDLIDD